MDPNVLNYISFQFIHLPSYHLNTNTIYDLALLIKVRVAVHETYYDNEPYLHIHIQDSIANLIPKWVGKRVNHPLVGKRDGLVHPMVGKRALVHPMAGKRYDHPMAGKRVDHPMVGKRTPILYQVKSIYNLIRKIAFFFYLS